MNRSPLVFEWAGPRDRARLEEWDAFLLESPRGHYCALSTWLLSFQAYGLSPLVLVARREPGGRVIGGIGILRFGALGMLGMTAPVGPLVDIGCEDAAPFILAETLRRARKAGAFLFQTQMPVAEENLHLPFLLPEDLAGKEALLEGRPFGAAAAPDQMLWVGFGRVEDASATNSWGERMLLTFNTNARRNIRKAAKSPLRIDEARTEPEIRAAFTVIENNGREQGYATRSWAEFGATLVEQVQRGQATVLTATMQDRLVGAHYSVRAGRRCSYLMGGTERMEEDPGIGHALHWSAMERAQEAGLLGYDLTTSGPPGVLRFKMGFHPEVIRLRSARHSVLAPLRYWLFHSVYPFAKRHKRTVANLLRRLRLNG